MTVAPATLRIGTRGSALALAQAALVARALGELGVGHDTVIVETAGDRRAPDTAWGEGAFVAAIEQALVEGRVDIAVHSAKDVPTDEDPRLSIAAYLPREEPRDALVLPLGVEATLGTLPAGTVVGTDSPRRTGFVRAHRPDLDVRPLHGNVDTRLRRLDEGAVGALVLAAAGLLRLGRADRITQLLPVEVVPPAPGQGAIAIQVRAADVRAVSVAAGIDDVATRAEVETERAFLAATGGGCRAPVGALARARDGTIALMGGTATRDGRVTQLQDAVAPADERLALAASLARRVVEERSRALGGPRVVLTREEAGSNLLAGRLAELGIGSAVVPAIAIETLDIPIPELSRYDVVVVTSANAVRVLAGAAADVRLVRWAVVGSATARELRALGAESVWFPRVADGAALARELPIASGDQILRLKGDLADNTLSQALRERGARVDDVTVYRTTVAPDSSRPLLDAALRGEAAPGALVFASPSAVRGLLALAGEEQRAILLETPAVAIGATTAQVAREAGFGRVETAASADADAVAQLAAEIIVAGRLT